MQRVPMILVWCGVMLIATQALADDRARCAATRVAGSAADAQLYADIATRICDEEKERFPRCAPELLRIESAPSEHGAPSGAELWHVHSCDHTAIYKIGLIPQPSGGTSFVFFRTTPPSHAPSSE